MPCRNGAIARALTVAGLALFIAVSCPNPIDDDLLLVVEDDITPSMVISEPLPNSYYHGDVTVTGTLADSSRQTGDGKGRLLTLSFSVSDASPLDRTVTFEADGSFTVEPAGSSFDWDTSTGSFRFSFSSRELSGFRILTFVARDLNGNESRQQIALQPYPFGPNLQLISPADFSIYDMLVIISGTVTDAPGDGTTEEVRSISWQKTGDLQPTMLKIDPTQGPADGVYRDADGSFTFNSSTGAFSDSFESFDLSGTIFLKVSASNVANSSSTTVTLNHNGTGPAIVLAGDNPEWYSHEVTESITIHGTVDTSNLATMRYRVLNWLVGGNINFNRTTGDFSFAFDPSSLTGNLTVETYAKDFRNIESKVEHVILEDAAPPGAPVVSGPASPTNDATPTWTWTTPPTTTDFQYSLDSSSGPWTVTTAVSWEPTALLSEGPHTLYVRARDSVGNASLAGTNALSVDTVAPSVTSFLINSGAAWTVSRDVRLTIAASDPLPASGLYQMRLRNDSDTGSWEAYSAIKENWLLSDVDGTRTVWVDMKDNAGNVRIGAASDSIDLDRTIPNITTFLIDNGIDSTKDLDVKLTIAASDTPGDPFQMQFSNDNSTWSAWETYAMSKDWVLAYEGGVAGTRVVFIQVDDQAGNIASASDNTYYDPD
jgi:hypothetical protein